MQGSTPCETWCRICLAAIRKLNIFLTTCCDAGKYAMRDLVQKLSSCNPQLKTIFWLRVATQGSTPSETWCRSCLAAIHDLNFFWQRVAMQGSTPCETWCRSCLAAIRNEMSARQTTPLPRCWQPSMRSSRNIQSSPGIRQDLSSS